MSELSVFDLAANIAESFVIICSVLKIAAPEGKRTPLWEVLAGVALTFAVTTVLNAVSLFSFLTIFIVIAVIFAFLKLVTHSPALLCAVGIVLVFLVVNTVDYLLLSLFELIIGSSGGEMGFEKILSPGWIRNIYLCVDKGADVLLYALLARYLPGLQKLPRKYLRIVFALSCGIYAVMTALLSLVLSKSAATVRASVLLTWILLVACAVMAVIILGISTKYQKERETNSLLLTSNALMEENYRNLHAIQTSSAKRDHDFIHHMKVLLDLSAGGKTGDIQSYIEALLATSFREASLCRSDNDIIDAIINSKAAEAAAEGITLKYQVNFSIPTDIESIDICSILANQIDNALDACRLMPEGAEREIDVHVWQKSGSMAIFQVSNTVAENPLLKNPRLVSTKRGDSRPHGLGLKSIADSAEKYNGILENSYSDGRFISTVLLSCRPMVGEDSEGKE